ncbi:MAG: hypothetical protein KF789_04660 [Bdellovibrionaceae bacterium]|nr:hypothetical protein [Pseudobdellovibrionaceae bacterium]
MKTLISVFVPMFLAGLLWAGPEFTYSQLALKDLDQMNDLVRQKIAAAKEGDNAPLKDGLQTVLSRPDEDFMIDKVMGPLRQELEEQDLWEPTMVALTDEAISALKNPKKHKAAIQATYAVFLTNTISQLKPKAREKGFERQLLEKIRDAKIELSAEMRDERRLRVMKETASPSTLAEQALGKPEKK